ncbi:histone deacetylase 7-like isoform X5 [Hypanus sabinus]|uniref:histone deacetylase 7-like isoform X5 n=1 Tax=Hypanus sabinus TaxID=79690 RepID=UPI0028C38AA1|nr:histone deacetylase 7-like isoform X5 [Hypanus sabinus]
MDLRIDQLYGNGGEQSPHRSETVITPHPLCMPLPKQQIQGPDMRCDQQGGSSHGKLRLLRNKDQGKQSTGASTAVKQRLQEFVLKKQEAALKNTVLLTATQSSVTYSREIRPPAQGLHQAPPLGQGTWSGDPEQEFPLRKTASEPNLKVRLKLRSRGSERRNSPLLCRKDSAPAGLGGRSRDALDTSYSASRPTLKSNSPQDTGHTPAPEPVGQTEGAKLLGFPSPVTPVPFHPFHLHRLPFLESALTHRVLLSAVAGLPPPYGVMPSMAPLVHGQPRTHRPLGRTQSAPLPRDPRAAQQQLHQQRQHRQFLQRLREHTQLSQRLLLRDQSRTLDSIGMQAESLGFRCPVVGHRPLSRAQSSPASTSIPTPTPTPEAVAQSTCSTGLVYEPLMLKHQCPCGGGQHPEHPGRIQSIWSRLQETGLRSQCQVVRGRKATLEELQTVHTETHVFAFGTSPLSRLKEDHRKFMGIRSQPTLMMLPCGGFGVDRDSVWNEAHSSNAARMAVGCVIELALRVARGDLQNGFAVVRPPGHHAEQSAAMGFCFFNSVAIAAKQLQLKMNMHKILIVDWDVHHGNGTQQVFYTDPSVLYISLHRHDDGNFFPGSGASDEVGSGPGAGFNVNIAWTKSLDPPIGDAEYLAAFRTVVMPIAKEFDPDMVLVSSGFDAVEGHPPQLGGYNVSAKCFGYLTRQLMSLAGGKIVMALEGGHSLTAICDAAEACVSALLGKEMDPLPEHLLHQKPNWNGVASLERVLQAQDMNPWSTRLWPDFGLRQVWWSGAGISGDRKGILQTICGRGEKFLRNPVAFSICPSEIVFLLSCPVQFTPFCILPIPSTRGNLITNFLRT